MTGTTAIRVLVVDDHKLVRQGVASLLAACDDIAVVATADRASEALDRCRDHEVDVVLMDLGMPDVDGMSGTALVSERFPDIHIVALADLGQEDSARAAVLAGANACLLKTVGVDGLTDTIRGVVQGRSTFSSEFLPRLLREPLDAALGANLTARERDVLSHMAAGLTNKGIAHELGLTEGTVRVYVSGILAKLGVANRTEASVVAIHELLVEPRSPKVGSSARRP